MLAVRAGVSTDDFYIQRRPGWRGRAATAVRKVLWKLLRYQHERVVFQQNTINSQLALALQLVQSDHLSEIRALEARVRALEEALRRAGVPAPGRS